MKITILCSDPNHPINEFLFRWVEKKGENHQIKIVRKKVDLDGGDLLFLISCSEMIDLQTRNLYKKSLVLHASDLPLGRGWSPHIWQIVNGAEEITLSLLEAKDIVDSGPIWKKLRLPIPKNALWYEINEILFSAEIQLIDFAIEKFSQIEPTEQDQSITPTSYRKRTPSDSRIDPEKSILDQFDKIRVSDPYRFPAFFDLYGARYKIILEKINERDF